MTPASAWQVRQPIYRSSVGRWQPYASAPEPLLAVLEGSKKALRRQSRTRWCHDVSNRWQRVAPANAAMAQVDRRQDPLIASIRPQSLVAIALAPRKAAILLNLAGLKPFTTASDPRLLALEALAEPGPALDADDEIAMHFALGKAFADLDLHERAFRHWVTGNALKRRRVIYDEADTLRTFARIRAVFGDALFAEPGGDPSEVPIFVVGMPRAGTTLIEQVLASHSKVFGAGEREDFRALVSTLAGPKGAKFPEAVRTLSPDARRRLGARYLERIGAAAPSAARIVDKMPMNFLYLGLIHLALPGARIVHVRRDPVDTCCSCFSILFTGNLVFTYELGELGRYYRAYETLMAHWRTVLPKGVMLELAYEDVVDDLEGQTHAILAHCGLEWEDACLAFHQTDRTVQTASVAQVRRPLYRSSVGRSRRYRPLIGPLLEALERPLIHEAV